MKGDSRFSSGTLRKRRKTIAGVTVSATIVEARMASEYDNASGLKNAPDNPSMTKTGSSAPISISDEKMMA